MTWNPYYYDAYLGQEPIVRDRRGERPRDRGERPRVPPRDSRGDQPLGPRVPPRDPRPRPVEDPRVTTPPFPQPQPDPRVTTRPEDLFPREDRDHDRDRARDRDRGRDRHWRHRRHREQYDPPWGHRYHRDYVFLPGWGWLPRWYPYWDQRWFDYWWFLYEYYGGDTHADYASYARDAVLRSYAPRYGWL